MQSKKALMSVDDFLNTIEYKTKHTTLDAVFRGIQLLICLNGHKTSYYFGFNVTSCTKTT